MTTPPVLVLGLGNDILTDDAVGLQVVAALRAPLRGETDIELKTTTEMGLALLDEISGRESLILVDAVRTGTAPVGHIRELDPGELPGPVSTAPHFLGIRETLVLGNLLGLPMPQQVRIVAVEVADPFTLGTTLTPAVAAVVDSAAARVATLARRFAAREAWPESMEAGRPRPAFVAERASGGRALARRRRVSTENLTVSAANPAG